MRNGLKNRPISIGVVFLIVTAGFLGFITFEPEVVVAGTIWYVGSGPLNDSTTINGGIALASDGDTVYVHSGTYDEIVIVNKTINLLGEDRDNTIIKGSGNGDVVRITADWVNISGFTITNSGFFGYPIGDDAGLQIESDNNTILNNNVSNNWNESVELGGFGIYLFFSGGNHIAGNTASNNMRGICLHHSWDNTIANNNVSLINEIGIYLEYSLFNDIEGNYVSNNGHGISLQFSNKNKIVDNDVFSNDGDGISLSFRCDFNIIANNTVVNNGDGIGLLHSNNNTVINNNASYNRYGIDIYESSSNIFVNNMMLGDGIYMFGESLNKWNTHSIDTSNTVNGKPVYYWKNHTGGAIPPGAGQVILANCTDVKIENQNVSSSSIGIVLGFSTSNDIVNNTASSNTMYGFHFVFSYYNTLTNNTASWNGANGFYVYGSSNNILSNNNASYNSNGIVFYFSDFNAIAENNISLNTRSICIQYSIGNNIKGNIVLNNDWGILLDYSDWNDIIGNTVSDMGYGIRLYRSSNNLVHHNNIIDNIVQAIDDRSDNYWDNGYPSGGNYWSDYTGIDLNSTPTQDVPPPDGIGDTPYVIDADSLDNYPLMGPVEGPVPPLLPPNLYITISSDGRDVILYWDSPSTPDIDHYLIYRSPSQTEFNFNTVWMSIPAFETPPSPIPTPITMFIDTNAADPDSPEYEEQYYYIIRAVNVLGEVSSTSRTVGKWTKAFPEGVSTFSLPLEPIYTRDTDWFTSSMNADYIKYMAPGTHTWVQHDYGMGGTNNVEMRPCEGYEVKLSTQTNYTFTGMPGAMISFDDDSGFFGFNPFSEAKNLTVSIQPNGDVNLTWPEPSSMSDGWYGVYYSNTRDGFFGRLNLDYRSIGSPMDFGTNTATHNGASANNPGTRLYYMVVPFNASGVRGASTYSIGIWTEEYLSQYDTFGIPLKLGSYQTADWYCDNIPDTVGMNYYIVNEQRWGWHSTRMPALAYDPVIVMTEGYQISTLIATKFIFIGV